TRFGSLLPGLPSGDCSRIAVRVAATRSSFACHPIRRGAIARRSRIDRSRRSNDRPRAIVAKAWSRPGPQACVQAHPGNALSPESVCADHNSVGARPLTDPDDESRHSTAEHALALQVLLAPASSRSWFPPAHSLYCPPFGNTL